MSAALESVLQHPGIWRGNQRAQTVEDALPTGFAALDELLPGGGWPRGALTELLIGRQGIGELRLLMPVHCLVMQKLRRQTLALQVLMPQLLMLRLSIPLLQKLMLLHRMQTHQLRQKMRQKMPVHK